MEENSNQEMFPIEKEQKLLKSSYEMYEKTIKDTKEHLKAEINQNTGDRMYSDKDIEDRVKLIQEAESDVIERYLANGGTMEDLKKTKKKRTIKKSVASKAVEEKKDEIIRNAMEEAGLNKDKGTETNKVYSPSKATEKMATFDVIPLPSKGECYSSKIDKVPVSFLTAYDENIIVSPNLYQENMVLDYILNEKIMSDDIDPDYMLDGDREAIILYLRAAGYGNEYPVTATDNATGADFDTVIDLSQIRFKEFNLKGDENGYFDYVLPIGKNKIKFKFLNHKENKELDELTKLEQKGTYKFKLDEIINDLTFLIDSDNELTGPDKLKAREGIKSIKDWGEKLPKDEGLPYNHLLTNKLEMEIVSVDGNTDRRKIKEFVKNMNVRDSSSLRRYIADNEPGLDYRFKVDKPESLGGGSMEIFLELDQFVFLNVSE